MRGVQTQRGTVGNEDGEDEDALSVYFSAVGGSVGKAVRCRDRDVRGGGRGRRGWCSVPLGEGVERVRSLEDGCCLWEPRQFHVSGFITYVRSHGRVYLNIICLQDTGVHENNSAVKMIHDNYLENRMEFTCSAIRATANPPAKASFNPTQPRHAHTHTQTSISSKPKYPHHIQYRSYLPPASSQAQHFASQESPHPSTNLALWGYGHKTRLCCSPS